MSFVTGNEREENTMENQQPAETPEPCITHAAESSRCDMSDTSETKTIDTTIHYGNDKCWVCGEPNVNGFGGMRLCVEHKAMDPAKPWEDANAEIERLQKVVADQALTIGTLKDELGKSRADREDWCAEANRVLGELGRATQLLAEERSLTAATAAHTTALERKVADLRTGIDDLLKQKRCEYLNAPHHCAEPDDDGRLPDEESYCFVCQLRLLRENPKPGAAT
jgi:hypothetical protein